jgi:iron(III) transport system substrate-binding protein
MKSRKISQLALSALCIVTVATGCGGAPPTSSSNPTGDTKAAATAQAGLDKVNDELKGLDPKARRAKLIELAKAEGGELTFYTTQSTDDITPVTNAFEDATGVKVNLYRAEGNTLVIRTQQEVAAGREGGDAVLADGTYMLAMDTAGDLLKLDTPVASDIKDASADDNWISVSYNAYLPMWNSNLVPAADAPKTWEDVFTKYQGSLGVDPADYDWFMTLVTQYFMKDKGMTEDQAIDYVTKGLAGAKAIRGHSVGAELLAAGDIKVHASQNYTRVADIGDAPIGWSPPVAPIVLRSSGTGIVSTTTKPASALLFNEFVLTDGQEIFVKQGLLPSNKSVAGGDVLDKYTSVQLDIATLAKEQKKWEDLFAKAVGPASG